MTYRVTISIGYYTMFFDFEDITEATGFMATATEKHAGSKDDKEVTISMVAVKEEKE